jgi:hypothetical protein
MDTKTFTDLLSAWSAADATTVEALVSPAGRSRGGLPETDPKPKPEPKPEPVPAGPAPAYESDYLVISKSGVVTLPSGVEYHGRKVEGLLDVSLARESRRAGLPLFLYGPPGTGKTKLLEAAFGSALHTILGTSDTEVSDFVGTYVQRPDGSYAWVDGPLLRAMEAGEVLMVDEVGLVDPKVMSVLYSVMDGRGDLNVTANPERGVVTAKDGFYVVAATNPNAPGVRLSEALLSRFAVHVEVTTDYRMAGRLGVDSRVVTAASNLDTKRLNGEVGWSPQMRELLATRVLMDRFGERVALRNLVSIAPEMDREVVADVLSKAFGWKVANLHADR